IIQFANFFNSDTMYFDKEEKVVDIAFAQDCVSEMEYVSGFGACNSFIRRRSIRSARVTDPHALKSAHTWLVLWAKNLRKK
ncbi:unnamed protein product, partial [Sphenostylis stenocarpa]